MNFFRGTLQPAGSGAVFVEDNSPGAALTLRLSAELAQRSAAHVNRPVILGIRPECVRDLPAASPVAPPDSILVTVEVVEPMGSETLLYLNTGATSFIARVRPTDRFHAGQSLRVGFDLERAHLFDSVSELRL